MCTQIGLVGSTMSGKTCAIKKLLRDIDTYFAYAVRRVIYMHHNYTQDVIDIESIVHAHNIEFVSLRYELVDFKTFAAQYCASAQPGACLVFADDCTQLVEKNDTFNVLLNDIRHHNTYMILGMHSFVYNNSNSRTTINNLQYFFFTINGRSRASILRFAQTVGLKNAAKAAIAYEEQECVKYAHVLFNLMPGEMFRVFTNIFHECSRYTNAFIEK